MNRCYYKYGTGDILSEGPKELQGMAETDYITLDCT